MIGHVVAVQAVQAEIRGGGGVAVGVVEAALIIIKISPLKVEASQPLPKTTTHFVNPRI